MVRMIRCFRLSTGPRKRATSSWLSTTGSISDRDDDGTGCEVSFLGQVEQIDPDLRWPENVGRFAKMGGEPDDLCDIHTLGVRCQVADLHVLDHATAKRAH